MPYNSYTPYILSIPSHTENYLLNEKPQYWIVFTGGETGGNVLHRVLKKGFWHVLVLMKMNDSWYLLDPTRYGLEVVNLNYTGEVDVPGIFNRENTRVVKIEKHSGIKKSYKLLSCLYCVSIVKFILSIRCYSLTPYQFYKKLIKMKKKNLLSIEVLV